MSIVDSLRTDMFKARKEGQISKSQILGMALASVKNVEIEKGELTDEQVIEVLRKEVKKLEDAYNQYKQGGRDDLANHEKEQLEALNIYLPTLMSEDQVRVVVSKVLETMPSATMKEMGIVMGAAMKELKGKADGSVVNNIVKEMLSK
ncbi:MAG: GatB/Yqey [candidate division WS6 bacterium GW2011_GWF2_39_15]|uniref:GatB/Yqey n=1 Tax=candidate division WS6 bacterium GW2011_GWF2_39_15 TaxID=1619100 RepID=A0A0G0MT55_9BACT|nr:MAG: GatB/Yqey [candidate division WS6 bacterium GW2011_GWF2_39_15]